MCSFVDRHDEPKHRKRCVNYFCTCDYFYKDHSPWLILGESIKRTRLNRFIGQICSIWRTDCNVLAWQRNWTDSRTIYNITMNYICGLFGTRHFLKVPIFTREERRKAIDEFRKKYGIYEDEDEDEDEHSE